MGFNQWTNESLLQKEKINGFRNRFESAKPFKHIVIKDFFKEEKARKLLIELKKEKFIEKESDLFSFKQTYDFYFTKNKVVKDFHKAFLSWDFFKFIESVCNVKLEGTLDMAGTLYESGDFLLCHDDKLEGRKIAYVFYLTKDFEEKDGGNFVLFNSINGKPKEIAQKHLPLFNHLLLFQVSRKSFHEVEENLSDKERYAVSGWLY